MRMASCRVLGLGGVPQAAGRIFDIGGADPVELPAVELGVLVAEQRLDRGGAAGDREGGAVARHGVGHVVGEQEPAGARHVLHDEARAARNVASHVAGERLGVEARAAAGGEADQDRDLLAAVEVGDRVLRGAGRGQGAQRETQDDQQSSRTALHRHDALP
jgi:hypothetical protein